MSCNSSDQSAPSDYNALLRAAGGLSHLPATASLAEVKALFATYHQAYLDLMLDSPNAAMYKNGLMLLSQANVRSKNAMFWATGESLKAMV